MKNFNSSYIVCTHKCEHLHSYSSNALKKPILNELIKTNKKIKEYRTNNDEGNLNFW